MKSGSLNPKVNTNVFKGMVIATSGELGSQYKDYNDANLSKWIRNYGGRYALDFDESVTHLVATIDQYKKKTKLVKDAMKQRVDIVDPNWLETSMNANKQIDPKKYTHKKIQQVATAKKRRNEKADKGVKEGEKYINTNLYTIYRDETMFEYHVTLLREEGERFIIELWESIRPPKLYYFGIKYHKKSGAAVRVMRPSETPGTFDREMRQFCKAFKTKTGVAWDDRIRVAENGVVSAPEGPKNAGFRYNLPTGGKPVGLVNGLVHDAPVFANNASEISKKGIKGSKPETGARESTKPPIKIVIKSSAKTNDDTDNLILNRVSEYIKETGPSANQISTSDLEMSDIKGVSSPKTSAAPSQQDILVARKKPSITARSRKEPIDGTKKISSLQVKMASANRAAARRAQMKCDSDIAEMDADIDPVIPDKPILMHKAVAPNRCNDDGGHRAVNTNIKADECLKAFRGQSNKSLRSDNIRVSNDSPCGASQKEFVFPDLSLMESKLMKIKAQDSTTKTNKPKPLAGLTGGIGGGLDARKVPLGFDDCNIDIPITPAKGSRHLDSNSDVEMRDTDSEQDFLRLNQNIESVRAGTLARNVHAIRDAQSEATNAREPPKDKETELATGYDEPYIDKAAGAEALVEEEYREAANNAANETTEDDQDSADSDGN